MFGVQKGDFRDQGISEFKVWCSGTTFFGTQAWA